jgi:hypothetical protein
MDSSGMASNRASARAAARASRLADADLPRDQRGKLDPSPMADSKLFYLRAPRRAPRAANRRSPRANAASLLETRKLVYPAACGSNGNVSDAQQGEKPRGPVRGIRPAGRIEVRGRWISC